MAAHATPQPIPVVSFRYMIFQTPQTQRMSAELILVETLYGGSPSPEDMHILEWVQMPAHATLQPIPVVSFKYMISLASISPPALCTHSKQAVCKSVITLSLITC